MRRRTNEKVAVKLHGTLTRDLGVAARTTVPENCDGLGLVRSNSKSVKQLKCVSKLNTEVAQALETIRRDQA